MKYPLGRHMRRVAGKKGNGVVPPTNPGRKKRLLRIAVNDVEPFPADQPVERQGKGKNIQIDRCDVKAAGPVDFIRDIRLNFLPRLLGVKNMNLAPLSLQRASKLMDSNLTAAFKPRPGRRKYGETNF